jgi:signal transduction histidine kinase
LTNDIPKTLDQPADAGPGTHADPQPPPELEARIVFEAAAAERARIGWLLHAGVLQELTIAALQLDALSRSLPPPASYSAGELGRLISAQQRAIREILSSSGTPEGEAR